VAATHGCDPATFALIDQAFAARRVRVAVIEGYATSNGSDPPRFARHFEEWRAKGFCHGGGESGYAAAGAKEHGARFIGGEPDERAVARAVLDAGFSEEDLLGFYFVRQVPQLRQQTALETESLDAAFHDVMKDESQKAGLEAASARFPLERFREWYAQRQGKPFDGATVDTEETAPVATGSYPTQRLSAVVGLVRDRFVVDLVAGLLSTDQNVLVVYGASHFLTQRPALELLMGKPVVVTARGP
jgi:hypothetical protein